MDTTPKTASSPRVITEKEQLFLNAIEFGQRDIAESLLNDADVDLNCVDYMGRNALILSIRCENLELIDLLLSKMSFGSIEDALLYAVSLEKTHIVKLILDHPAYVAGERIYGLIRSRIGAVHRSEERSQFSPDITPLILAAHYNNHEIVQLFLTRGHTVDVPHLEICGCIECKIQRDDDPLVLERSRLNAYRALSSPAYLALTCKDPVTQSFELAQTLRRLAKSHKEFKEEYTELAEQCMQFATDIVNLCRSAKEVEATIMGYSYERGECVYDPLAVIKMGLKYEEKKFIAHANCQMHCMKYFYRELSILQHMNSWLKLLLGLLFTPLVPIFCLIYIIHPNFQVTLPKIGANFPSFSISLSRLLNCPAIKFMTHSMSYLGFLSMLTVATFRGMEEMKNHEWSSKATEIFRYDFRTSDHIISPLQWALIGYLIGHGLMECKEIYTLGIGGYASSYYNLLDTISMCLYLASYSLRLVVSWKIESTRLLFGEQLSEARNILFNETAFFEPTGKQRYRDLRYLILSGEDGYWLRGCRGWWRPDDPEIVSDCMFAVANWLSFARVTFMMPAWEVLGPLQISLGRMVTNIARFFAIFGLFLFGFVVAMTNLYWYYAKYVSQINDGSSPATFQITSDTNRNRIGSIKYTFINLYWTLFGMMQPDMIDINPQLNSTFYENENYVQTDAGEVMNTLGTLMLACYTGFMIIILINMLIAMMSHAFEVIQNAADYEWKFARCNLWMWYIDQEGSLPVPFNMVPSTKTLTKLARLVRNWVLQCCAPAKYKLQQAEKQSIKMHRPMRIMKKLRINQTSFASVLAEKQRGGKSEHEIMTKLKENLLRRYLFKLQREREESKALKFMQAAMIAASTGGADVFGTKMVSEDDATTQQASAPPLMVIQSTPKLDRSKSMMVAHSKSFVLSATNLSMTPNRSPLLNRKHIAEKALALKLPCKPEVDPVTPPSREEARSAESTSLTLQQSELGDIAELNDFATGNPRHKISDSTSSHKSLVISVPRKMKAPLASSDTSGDELTERRSLLAPSVNQISKPQSGLKEGLRERAIQHLIMPASMRDHQLADRAINATELSPSSSFSAISPNRMSDKLQDYEDVTLFGATSPEQSARLSMSTSMRSSGSIASPPDCKPTFSMSQPTKLFARAELPSPDNAQTGQCAFRVDLDKKNAKTSAKLQNSNSNPSPIDCLAEISEFVDYDSNHTFV